jgi:hypothetical protein
MAVDLTGINNENEFYTNHYLSAIFENDIKDVLSRWKQDEEDGTRPPYAQIRTICKNYFLFSNSFEKEKTLAGRLELQREWLQLFLPALGYELQPQFKTLDTGFDIPIIFESKKSNGAPDMWIIEDVNLYVEDDQDPLSLSFSREQFQAQEMSNDLEGVTLDTVITKFVFGMEEPPRWILVVNNSQVILLDRSKWNEKRMIRFDIPEILGRKEDSTLKATAALLHRESICPDDGIPLLDTLDEKSHKHAFSVSEDLKYALREAIELIGNEAIYYLQEVRRKGVFSGEEKVDDKELTRECLRYMYRLLFVLYIEARPELGYIPMKSDAYRLGYSFESLRDLEIVKLNNEESKNGYYIDESINILFSLIYNGLSGEQQELKFQKGVGQKLFEIPSLKTHLFDPERTPILNKVKFRNAILQRIIELMSLSRQGGRNNRRGRISYAQLGINQLGAVYEALLSYQGFFADTDLYEVKKAGESYDELKNAYFVKADDLEKYTDDEKVYNADGTLKKYEKGAFLYRLAGRDREKSASYYTPEVLTNCLVKYALKELLKDKTADDILKLTVCEPAMGSAAFLNEAINQLAEAYLERKQRELGERIAHDEYAHERQKVKMYVADNNVFGVDLNPVAVELAEVSLWLNTISKENFVPWFGMQLVCGNSLIGARRQVFEKTLLKKENKTDSLWINEVPERVMLNEKRNKDTVYHFLLPDKGMTDYKDNVVKQLASEHIIKINEWQKSCTSEFSKNQIKTLQKLSDTIDTLWSSHIEQQCDMRRRTTDTFAVWGQQTQSAGTKESTGTRWKDKVLEQELLSKKIRNSSPYRRLKLAMDYWCSLWFWPIEKAGLLPSRDEYLLDLSLILEGNPVEVTHDDEDQFVLFPDTMPRQMQLKLVNELGFVDVNKLCNEVDRLSLVQIIAEKYRFLHWELEFADLFYDRGGFDLVLGNPPWTKVEWNESGVMGDIDPLFVLHKYSASNLASLRLKILDCDGFRNTYFEACEESIGMQNFLVARQNFNELSGSKTNSYKCFVVQSWHLNKSRGVTALVTYEGIFNDPNGGVLREICYRRLKYWFRFENQRKLFPQIGNAKKYELSIYGSTESNISFDILTNLYHPSTVDRCYEHSGEGVVPGQKDRNGDWELTGHRNRIVRIDKNSLDLFAKLYDPPRTPFRRARLPILHSYQFLKVLEKLSAQSRRLEDLGNKYFLTQHWNETNAQTDGTIKRKTLFPGSLAEVVLSGPHFHIANSGYQTPKRICNTHRAYDTIDLEIIPDDYLPRTNYVPQCAINEYVQRTPKVPWDEQVPVTAYYRLAYRAMIAPELARTLIGAIIPPEVAHINGVQTASFQDNRDLLWAAFFGHSIIADFYIKSTGRSNLHSTWLNFPLLNISPQMIVRTLMLNAITCHYEKIWAEFWDPIFLADQWANDDFRLNQCKFKKLSSVWCRESAFRTQFERRQALVEIDVLAAMALGIELDELKLIYRVQFPVLNHYEDDTWYDQKGRIVFTCNKGLSNIGFSRSEWAKIKDMKEGLVELKVVDDTLPGGPQERTIIYHSPFDRCDREKDYEIAWKVFERQFKDKEDSS